jgi:hypothetical protein
MDENLGYGEYSDYKLGDFQQDRYGIVTGVALRQRKSSARLFRMTPRC